MIKIIKISLISLFVLIAALAALVYALTFHPEPRQAAALTCPDTAPVFDGQTPLQVASYNVQYMAGKDYVFFYDLIDNSGPDIRPSAESLERTLNDIATLLIEIDADIILLQELHEDHVSSDYQNQTELLLEKLQGNYPCSAEAFYWKADFVPMAELMGSVGMKLLTLSKYKIEEAERHQLSLIPSDPVSQAFGLKRAILSANLPVSNGEPWFVMNTHLDAFSQGTDTMTQQVAEVSQLISEVSTRPWLIGGDFNLLAEGQYEKLPESQRLYYNPEPELTALHDQYPSVPSLEAIQGPDSANWYTHYPNDPSVSGPDRTIDYIFYNPELELVEARVVQGVATTLSDHLPVVGVFQQ